jgi:phosphate starvation-inducible protein PhoH and related proteins
MAIKNKPSFDIPQLKQKITVNCKKLDDKQLHFLEKSLSPKTKLMFVSGPAGTAKTYMAVYSALRLLGSNDSLDLLYVRTVIESAEKGLGALPGDLDEKFNPYIAPLMDKLDEMLPKTSTIKKDLLNKGRISAVPINFLRGANWRHKVVIADEAQNFTFKELTTLVTRAGEGSRIFVCGDPMQSDINGRSGFVDMFNIFNDAASKRKGIECFEFSNEDIKRSAILKFIISKLSNHGAIQKTR